MKLNTRDFGHRCQIPLLMLAALLPLPLAAVASRAPEYMGTVGWMALLCLAETWLCLLIPGKRRVAAGILCALSMIALDLLIFPLKTTVLMALPGIIFAATVLAMLPVGGWAENRELYAPVLAVGMVLHLGVQLMLLVDRQSNGTALTDRLSLPLQGLFLLYAALFVFAMNRQSMHAAATGDRRAPLQVVRRNRVMTGFLLLAAVLIASVRQLGEWLEQAGTAIAQWILKVLQWLGGLMATEPAGDAAGGSGELAMTEEATEPSLLVRILEKIAIVLAMIGVAILTFLLIRFLIRKARKLILILRDRLQQYISQASDDYTDEVEDLRSGGEKERIRRSRFRKENEKDLSPRERIRYRYRVLRHRHPEWPDSATAREQIDSSAAELYELARYSDHPVDEAQAERFASLAGHIRKDNALRG